jgi:fumarate reductase subunit C
MCGAENERASLYSPARHRGDHGAVRFAAHRRHLFLARTRGSVAWATFYGVFVLAISIHASIGVRTILGEWLGLRGRARATVAFGFGLLLLMLGLRAIAAVVLP